MIKTLALFFAAFSSLIRGLHNLFISAELASELVLIEVVDTRKDRILAMNTTEEEWDSRVTAMRRHR